MSPLIAAPALLFCLLAYVRYAWVSRQGRAGPNVGFLDLPLGLAVSVRLDLPPVAARERVRSAFLKSGSFQAIAGEGGRVAFRQGDRVSPWFGDLWHPVRPQVFVGSYVAEPAASGGSQLLVRFSTVPVAGWALAAGVVEIAYLGTMFFAHQRGLWFWLSALALLLAVRWLYQAEVRRIGWQLLDLLELRG